MTTSTTVFSVSAVGEHAFAGALDHGHQYLFTSFSVVDSLATTVTDSRAAFELSVRGVQPVPEPASAVLVGVAALLLGNRRRRA